MTYQQRSTDCTEKETEMQNLLTLGTEDNELNFAFTDRIMDPGFQVEFEDVEADDGLHGQINDIYVTDAFGTRKHINGVATIDKQKGYVSLHLMSGTIEHSSFMHAIYAALQDFAGAMKPQLPPSNKTGLSGCGVHTFYVD